MATKSWASVLVAVSLLATACIDVEGPPAALNTIVSITNENADYEPGEPIGLRIHFDPTDQETHGLPESNDFIATNNVGARTSSTMEAWIGLSRDDQPDPWGCSGPIEIRDETDQVLLTIDDFCSFGVPNLRIFGDLRAGTDVRYEFRGFTDPADVGNSPHGEVVIEVPDR